jgi:hypothetical protein
MYDLFFKLEWDEDAVKLQRRRLNRSTRGNREDGSRSGPVRTVNRKLKRKKWSFFGEQECQTWDMELFALSGPIVK